MSKTRLFFVVDSEYDNEELYTTLEEAEKEYSKLLTEDNNCKARLRICLVKNAYRQSGSQPGNNYWNYDDYSDTFETVKTIYD